MEIRKILKEMRDKGYYLITITAIDWGDVFEIIYHLSKGNDVKNIRFIVFRDEEVPSISDIFPNAFIYEWEQFEKVGVKFRGAKRLFGD